MIRFLVQAGLFASLIFPPALYASANTSAPKLPRELSGVAFDQKLDAAVPLDTMFRDANDAPVRLGKYFRGKPVILATVYYRCPMLCSQILSGIVRGLRPLSLEPGRDFEIVAVSINPAETPQDAAAKQESYSRSYSKKAGPAGWHFLVGSEPSIKAVTEAIGFHFRYDPESKTFFHASGVTVLTPEGRVSRYLYGVEYEPKDLKLSLIEASHERIGSPVDQVLLFCYHYDPKTGKYGAVVVNLLKITSGFVLLILVLGLTWLWRRDLRQYAAPIGKAGHP